MATASGTRDAPEKVAVTATPEESSTSHVGAVPVHPPAQPTNVAPTAGAAVSVTVDPLGKPAVSPPHTRGPVGRETIVPSPATATTSGRLGGAKVAVTAFWPSIVRSHAPVPVHGP